MRESAHCDMNKRDAARKLGHAGAASLISASRGAKPSPIIRRRQRKRNGSWAVGPMIGVRRHGTVFFNLLVRALRA